MEDYNFSTKVKGEMIPLFEKGFKEDFEEVYEDKTLTRKQKFRKCFFLLPRVRANRVIKKEAGDTAKSNAVLIPEDGME